MYMQRRRNNSDIRIAEKFSCFLHAKGHIEQWKLDKNTARTVFKNSYQEVLQNKKINFHIILIALIKANLINSKNKNKNVIYFKEQNLSHLLSTNKTNPLQPLPTHVLQQNSENHVFFMNNNTNDFNGKRKKNQQRKTKFVSQRLVLRKKTQDRDLITETECELCDLKFENENAHNNHLSDTEHVLRKTYRTNRKELICENTNIIIESQTGHGGDREDIVARIDSSYILLKIKNIGSDDYEIDQIYHLYKKINEIALDYSLPIVLKQHSSHNLRINFSFRNEGSYILPIIFQANNKTKKKSFKILKDLIIRVQSEFVDDLKPISPYKKLTRPVVIIEELPIISGTYPERPPNELVYVRNIQSSNIPHGVRKILNSGFKQYAGMTQAEYELLISIKKMLNVPEPNNCFNSKNYTNILTQLLYIEEHEMIKNIHEFDCEGQILKIVPTNPHLLCLQVPGLSENRPSLIRCDSVLATVPNNRIRYEGIVHTVRKNEVYLGFHSSFVHSVHSDGLRYNISFSFNRFPLRAGHQAVSLTANHGIANLFFPTSISNSKKLTSIQLDWFNKSILTNKEQQQAVRHIISCTSWPAPYLLFGPPGTGKTMTLVEAILQLWKTQPKCNILVAAPSNSAANELTSRLIKVITNKADLLRMLSVSFLEENIPADMKPYCNYRDNSQYFPSIETIMSYRIVVVTLVTAARLYNSAIPHKHFQYVFVDESGHSTESEVLIAIAGIISSAEEKGKLSGQIILSGDPKQLGPIVHSNLAVEYGYGTSMLERLMNTCDIYKKDPNTGKYNSVVLTKLLKNFRSHPGILKLPDRMFYEDELEPCGGDITNIAINWEHLPNKKFPLIFHSVMGNDEREINSPSYFNCQEIDVIIKYLSDLIGKQLNGMLIDENHVGIVTPYRKQVQKLTLACKRKGWKNLLIGSVEQFQGQERLIIIISTVRSKQKLVNIDYRHNLGFLKNPKRFNVAITRAKSLLIVVGNPLILQCDKHWGEFVGYCKENDAVTGAKFHFQRQYLNYENETLDLSQLSEQNVDPKNFDFSRGCT